MVPVVLSWCCASALGFPTEFFPVLFAIPQHGRVPLHWKESLDDPDTKILRPQQVLTVPPTPFWLASYNAPWFKMPAGIIPCSLSCQLHRLHLPCLSGHCDPSYCARCLSQVGCLSIRLLCPMFCGSATKVCGSGHTSPWLQGAHRRRRGLAKSP